MIGEDRVAMEEKNKIIAKQQTLLETPTPEKQDPENDEEPVIQTPSISNEHLQT